MQIHQMSVAYLAEQDRILVRVNTTGGEEMRLWLTRRLMIGLWPMLSRMLTDHLLKFESAGAAVTTAAPELKKMLADFRKEEFLQHADFDTPYKEGQQRTVLGEEPLLVTDVDGSPLPNGPLRLTFNERPPGGDRKVRSFQVEMAPKLMQGLLHLLEQSLTQSQWREPFVHTAANEPATDEAGHKKPRYLN